jgi:hypothetical protein
MFSQRKQDASVAIAQRKIESTCCICEQSASVTFAQRTKRDVANPLEICQVQRNEAIVHDF